jgi:hypothetical protein
MGTDWGGIGAPSGHSGYFRFIAVILLNNRIIITGIMTLYMVSTGAFLHGGA